jgi:hypothetical protein
MAEGQIVRDKLSATAIRRDWPNEILTLIEYIDDDHLDELDDRIRDAELSGDWDELREQAEELSASGAGFR